MTYEDEIPDEERFFVCQTCGETLDWKHCWAGCDNGYFDRYDEDPLWYDPGDLELCSECHGQGGYLACPNAENHPAPVKIEAVDK